MITSQTVKKNKIKIYIPSSNRSYCKKERKKKEKNQFPLQPTLHLLNALINMFTSLYIKRWGTDKFKNTFLQQDKTMKFSLTIS